MLRKLFIITILSFILNGCALLSWLSKITPHANKGIQVSTNIPIGNKGQGTIGKSQSVKKNSGNLSGHDINKYQGVQTIKIDYGISWNVVVIIFGIIFILLVYSFFMRIYFKIKLRNPNS